MSVLLVASALAVGGVVATQQAGNADEPATQDTSFLRVVHASPDAPAVDVAVDNETVLTGVEFSTVSDYLTLESGPHNVTITANESGAVVFNDTVTLDAREATTVAAAGEVGENATVPFQPIVYEDNALEPEDNESAISVIHLSPDAPTVDVTVGSGNNTTVIADNVSFGEASDYLTVPAGNYTVDIREATAANNGTVVATTELTLEDGSAHSALAVGFFEPENDTEPFQVVKTDDATADIELPGEPPVETGPPDENETGPPAENETGEPAENETGPPAENETGEPAENETAG